MYFNPPYSCNVKTDVGRKFLQLVDKSFPPGHPLRPIFNRNTLKISYSCMPNMGAVLAGHNKKHSKKPPNQTPHPTPHHHHTQPNHHSPIPHPPHPQPFTHLAHVTVDQRRTAPTLVSVPLNQ